MSADAPRGAPAEVRSRRAPTWPRVAAVAALLVLTVVVSRTCQQDEIRVTQEEALALATEQVRFDPEDPQIRLLRQGIDRHPFWIVSLSVVSADGETFDELAVVRIDATSGEVVEVRDQSVEEDGPGGEGGNGEGGNGDGQGP